MLAIQVPTWMREVTLPISWAVAIVSLLTSVLNMASKPASSAARATVRTSRPASQRPE